VKKGWRRRFVRWFAIGTVAVFLVTALPVVAMRWLDPWYSAFMLDAALDASRAGKANYRTDYRWVDLEQISPHAAVAVIAAEDQFFPFHTGFDFKSIREAIRSNEKQAERKRPRVRGASTISQQVAKNLFLWPGRSYVRKGFEAYFTLLIELTWPKERILEVYLNVAQFGDGVYGVEAAAQRFYKMPAVRLGRYEAATMAAVLPNPITFKVNAPSAYVVKRRDFILDQMRRLGGPNYLRELDNPTGPPQTKPPPQATSKPGASTGQPPRAGPPPEPPRGPELPPAPPPEAEPTPEEVSPAEPAEEQTVVPPPPEQSSPDLPPPANSLPDQPPPPQGNGASHLPEQV
jgi:monofunctional biosynthetic peptidoglycan transglycosylase